MIVDCISDLHGHYPTLEGGDLLIVAGDLTARHSFQEMEGFEKDWLRFEKKKYKKTVLIAGNHDTLLEQISWDWKDVEYLCDSVTEFEGLKIWGSPWTKRFKGMNPRAMAFTVDTEEELAKKWAKIPDDTDILITHGPPKGILDELTEEGHHAGSVALENAIRRIRPLLHVFGHVHECGGCATTGPLKTVNALDNTIKETLCVNASHVNEYYEPMNKPIRVIL